jgi:shikimate kinase
VRSIASACGSATVVNAIASGRGAAFAVDLRVRADVELTDDAGEIVGRIVNDPSESANLIEICARKVLQRFKLLKTYGARIRTTSDFPIAVGLSSSSAAANATVLGTFAALGKKPDPKTILNIGIDAAFEAGVTVTGAFDDASASFLGGGAVTDNQNRRILKRFRIDPKLDVLIYVPHSKFHTARVDLSRTKPLAKLVSIAHHYALDGDIFRALTLNGLLYTRAFGHDVTVAFDAMNADALAAGLTGTGPAVVAIANPENVEDIKDAWSSRDGRIIFSKATKHGAQIEAQI